MNLPTDPNRQRWTAIDFANVTFVGLLLVIEVTCLLWLILAVLNQAKNLFGSN